MKEVVGCQKEFEAWMGKWVCDAHLTHFETSEVTSKQYMSGRDSRMEEFKQELSSGVSDPVLLTVHLKEQLASLEEGAN